MHEIFTAIARNDSNRLKEILDSGLDPNTRDSYGRTGLMQASLDGKDDLIRILIAHRANLDAQDKNGDTALHFAAQDYRPGAVELLCEAGASVGTSDTYGNAPLWRAVFNSRNRGKVIKILLRYGADPRRKNKKGKSPIDLANTIANYDAKQFLPLK